MRTAGRRLSRGNLRGLGLGDERLPGDLPSDGIADLDHIVFDFIDVLPCAFLRQQLFDKRLHPLPHRR